MKKISIGSHFVTLFTLLCIVKVIDHPRLESILILATWVFEFFAITSQISLIYWMTKIPHYNVANDQIEAKKPRTVKSRIKTVLLRVLALISLYIYYTHGHIGLTCIVALNLVLSYGLRQLLFNFYDKIHGK